MYRRIQISDHRLSGFISPCVRHPYFIPIVFFSFVIGVVLFSPEIFALSQEDQVAELVPLTTAVVKLSKNACHIIASASAAIGTLWSVAAQNLKIFAASATITILALKAPSFFTATMLI